MLTKENDNEGKPPPSNLDTGTGIVSALNLVAERLAGSLESLGNRDICPLGRAVFNRRFIILENLQRR